LILLNKFSETFPNPLLLVQVINVQLYFPEQAQSAYNNLLLIEKRFSKSRDPHFKLELYTNLGHLANRLGLFKEHVVYRQKALKAGIKYNNIQQIGICEYNLARSLQINDRLLEAVIHYKKAIFYSEQAKDVAATNVAKLYLTQVNLQQNQNHHAREIFNSINIDMLASNRRDFYFELKDALSKTSS